MAEIEYEGIKISGGKMLFVLPLLATIGGALWGGFEFYKDYMDMRDKIQSYVAPDLSGLDTQQQIIEAEFDALKAEDQAMSQLIRVEVNGMKEGLGDVKSDLSDIKRELKDDMSDIYSIIDAQDSRNRDNVETVRGVINAFEIRMDAKIDRLDQKIDELEENLDKKIKRALDNPLAN